MFGLFNCYFTLSSLCVKLYLKNAKIDNSFCFLRTIHQLDDRCWQTGPISGQFCSWYLHFILQPGGNSVNIFGWVENYCVRPMLKQIMTGFHALNYRSGSTSPSSKEPISLRAHITSYRVLVVWSATIFASF